jgi:hypothetical protein
MSKRRRCVHLFNLLITFNLLHGAPVPLLMAH